MTIKELKIKLEQFDENLMVVVSDGDEDHFVVNDVKIGFFNGEQFTNKDWIEVEPDFWNEAPLNAIELVVNFWG